MPDRASIIAAIKALCVSNFNGDYQAGFAFYASGDGTEISEGELETLLKDAGVGNWVTRPIAAREIIRELDTNGDGLISWPEFQVILQEVSP